jgi:hypothetical protein
MNTVTSRYEIKVFSAGTPPVCSLEKRLKETTTEAVKLSKYDSVSRVCLYDTMAHVGCVEMRVFINGKLDHECRRLM